MASTSSDEEMGTSLGVKGSECSYSKVGLCLGASAAVASFAMTVVLAFLWRSRDVQLQSYWVATDAREPSVPFVQLAARGQAGYAAARVFLPAKSPEAVAYYTSSRFDWGSMVGDVSFCDQTLFPSNYWRMPHDPKWPEAGVGLAAEFGCGGDVSTCDAAGGWGMYENASYKGSITNGLLGYEEAGHGEAFVKIGVGKLLKGSCESCGDGDDKYYFNSPYKFAEQPEWQVATPSANVVQLSQEVTLSADWGYSLQKTISMSGATLTVQNILKNKGKKTFTTPWYSHNLLSVADSPTGPSWELAVDSSSFQAQPWSPQFNEYFKQEAPGIIKVASTIQEPLAMGAMFSVNVSSDGFYSATYHGKPGTSTATVHVTLQGGPRPLYGYNIYAESRTLSPEPILLLSLASGGTATWTQRLMLSYTPQSSS
eukprot:TRINITY_DN105349_c0_g1_i1.p1 TRINITY_DN105349_c0_g1~~TRINITY_DN105349_c0_g1_i1.p1  ORF type:complete len:426 (-),score=71.88 TRINITY_DN105349_c0_g1_i1:38-1315(-)